MSAWLPAASVLDARGIQSGTERPQNGIKEQTSLSPVQPADTKHHPCAADKAQWHQMCNQCAANVNPVDKKIQPKASKELPKSSQSPYNVLQKFFQSPPKVIPKSLQCPPKVLSKSSQGPPDPPPKSPPKVLPKSSQSRPDSLLTPSRNVVPKMSQSRPHV